MASSRPLAFGMRIALGAVLGVGALLSAAWPANANGIHVGSRDVYTGEVGPYRLTVTTTPIVGPMHFIISISDARDGSPVQGVEVTLQGAATDPTVPGVGPVAAYQTPEGPRWYAVDLSMETAGLWEFTLTVDSTEGREQATFPVAVMEASGGSLTLFALIAVALAIFGFTLGNRIFGRRRRRARGRRPQG